MLCLCMPLMFASSCGYMFGVHDGHSRVTRSIMLHTLGEASTTVPERNCSDCHASSLTYSLTPRPVILGISRYRLTSQ
ncbi:hypothetical protein EDC04DRAFT_2802975 [Pisolithus marmoratus]|nr:hypothetical protein EDC04DRAFT_2802975 [Pisolithus marmoratus]